MSGQTASCAGSSFSPPFHLGELGQKVVRSLSPHPAFCTTIIMTFIQLPRSLFHSIPPPPFAQGTIRCPLGPF